MKKSLPFTNCNSSLFLKTSKKVFIIIFFLFLSFSGFAHSVTSYTPTCGAGPAFSVQPIVASVNSTSNYRWQFKNASNVWVCIVNGTNVINGNSYTISGAVYNLTTTPGPIVFTNPNSGLQGLVIRCVISDGAGVDPCTMPAGNTWNSDAASVNLTINVSGTACGGGSACNAKVTNLYFNKLDGGTDIPITNGAVFTIAQLGSLYNMEAGTSGTVGSVKYTITGPTPTSNIENSTPYNSPTTGSGAWTGAAGTYSVNLKTYSSSDATGSLCHDTTISFSLSASATGSIGDRVWLDADGDGIQDASETGGITGVTVQLKNSAGTVIATTNTNASGNYLFSGLSAGNYKVVFPLSISGAVVTTQNVGANDDIDSDPSQTTGETGTIALASGQNIINVDAGYCPTTLAVGNRVWNDVNNNGINDSENGIAGAVLNLYKDDNNDNVADGPAIATTTADGTGTYMFSNLAPGNYIVGVVTPVGYTSSTINGGDPDNDINLDDNGQVTVGNETRGLAITLIAGTEPDGTNTNTNTNITYDFGFFQNPANLVSLGNLVFIDRSGNGKYDPSLGETGYDGATVRIYADNNDDGVADGAALATQTTAGGGLYNFTGLAAGKYFVQIESVPSWMFKSVPNGGDPDNDLDNDNNGLTQTAAPAVIKGATITLSVGGEPDVAVDGDGTSGNKTYDFGIFKTNGLGDFVFLDADADGIQDAGEGGIAGVTVRLRNTAGTLLATTTTDATGYYYFYDPAQYGIYNYNIEFVTPTGYSPSPSNAGGDDSKDSDPVGGTITNVSVPNGTWNYTFDAGFVTNNCNCPGANVVLNPGFESGTTNWTWSGGTLSQGTGGVACGSFSGDLDNTSATSKAWQIIGTDLAVGTVINATVFAGTHVNTFNNFVAIEFLDASNVVLGSSVYVQVDKILANAPAGPQLYSISATVPAGVKYTRVAFGGNGSFTKTDQWCVTLTAPPVGSLGDRVWKDDNGNGIQDAGEVGVAGVTIVLLNSAGQVVATTTTDANGNYLFKDLQPGNYSLRITPPANYSLSAKTQGADVNSDSDFDPVSYTTGTVTLAAGQNRTDIDAGLKFIQPAPASVGDRVWLDTNGDGVQDAGEPGVSNVLVTLYNNSGVAVASTYTDANGLYLFTNVAPGNYTAGVSLPPAMVFSPNNGAVSVTNNSDINPANGRTATFTVNAGDQIRYVDAGLKPQVATNGSVGDFVWNDLNKDGVQDAGEPGIAGVTVRLVNAITNTIIATTVTDANGKYIFNDVPPGSYQVDFVTPAGYTTTTKLNSNVILSGTDSDVDPATSRTAIFALGAGDRITSVDAGYWVTTPPGTGKIGDRVWHDANQNGIQDAGEPNVAGMSVTLYDGAGVAIKKATTDQNGNYLFTDLAAGNYTVGFNNIPDGYTFTVPGLGTAANGSDVNPATGRTATITLAAGQTNLDVDAGIRAAQAGTASLGNRIWYDLNNNGLQEAGEVGVQGATVELLDAAGAPIDKDPVTPGVQPTITTTNALGEYLFTGLGAGDYRVRFSTLPAGYAVVAKAAGTDRNLDSDGNPLAAGASTTDVVSLSANQDRLDIDLGIFNPTAPLGQIGDRVWFDSNNNGIQDATEQGVPGVSVALLNAAGTVIATTVTDKDGLYKFVNLADATYTVQFSNLPAGFNFSGKDLGGNDNLDSDADPVTGRTGTYVISGGNTNLTVDAGIFSTRAALGDYVWFDANKDGIQDATESGIAGVTVILYNAAGAPVTSMITDQNGRYYFSNLNPGTYTVGFSTIPAALVFTTKDVVAAGDAADSDVDPATGRTGSYTLAAGQVNLTVDAGLKPVIPASVGDFVWFDLNRDGIQDANEPGVPGVIVTLYNSANQPIGSAVTDGNGKYLISNVPPGTGYYVQFSNQPDPAAPWTLQNVGGVNATNNSKADATGKTTSFDVADGQNVTNVDAGLFRFINLSGNVWHDVNALTDNLVNNTGPLQVPPAATIPVGLRAYLVNATTGLIERSTIVSSATGTFNFNNINPNTTYRVYLSSVSIPVGSPEPTTPTIIPGGWEHTGQKLGITPGSDGINDGRLTVPVGVNSVINVNFGIRVSAGDVVQG